MEETGENSVKQAHFDDPLRQTRFNSWVQGMDGNTDVDGARLSLHRFRHRAHANPLNDTGFAHPTCPADFNLSCFYPAHPSSPVTMVDIGCGYGDLLVEIARQRLHSENDLMMGLEIRGVTTRIAQQQVISARASDPECSTGSWDRVAFVRCNVMKHVTHYFPPASLHTMFILFADPQFKLANVRRRIVSMGLLDDYASLLADNAHLYVATDVPELFAWECACLDAHPRFRRDDRSAELADPLIPLILSRTADADRADRKGSDRQCARWVRVPRGEKAMEAVGAENMVGITASELGLMGCSQRGEGCRRDISKDE